MLDADNVCLYDNARALLPPTSVQVSAGEFVKVVGANGAGKTSFLKALAGILPPDEGEVRWQGTVIDAVAEIYREDLLYVGHQNGIASELSPLENLRVTEILRLRAPRRSFDEALADAGLASCQRRRCYSLSAGQRRRTALAGLRAFWARLWLLDEPLAGVDADGRNMLTKWLEAHLASGGMAVATMHNADDWPVAAARVASCGNAA